MHYNETTDTHLVPIDSGFLVYILWILSIIYCLNKTYSLYANLIMILVRMSSSPRVSVLRLSGNLNGPQLDLDLTWVAGFVGKSHRGPVEDKNGFWSVGV